MLPAIIVPDGDEKGGKLSPLAPLLSLPKYSTPSGGGTTFGVLYFYSDNNNKMGRGTTSVRMKSITISNLSHAQKHHNQEHRATLKYVHHELTVTNERWDREYKANGNPKSLNNYFTAIKKNVKEKTGRSIQERAADNALQEAVVVIDEKTTMDDLKRFSRAMEDEFGFTAIQIHIHRDEGYLKRTEKLNLHAHIVFETIDRTTGKTWKPKADRGSRMQDIAAETLGMVRGTPKFITQKKGLDAMEYKEEQARKNLEVLKEQQETIGEEVEEARKEKQAIERRTKEFLEGTTQKLSEMKEIFKVEHRTIEESIKEAREELQSISEMKRTAERERDEIRQNKAVLQRDLEGALTQIEEKHKKSYQKIKEENTKIHMGGLIKGSVDYEAVSDELWRQQVEQEKAGYRKEYLQVSKHKSERDKAIQEKNKAQEELKDIKRENENLKVRLLQSLGDRFSLFWEDVKRFSKNFLMAVGLWQGETWSNSYKKEEYTADKKRCVLLINGKSIDERTAEIEKRKQEVYQVAVTTSGKSWADFRFHELHKIDKVRDYNRMMDEINDIESTATRGHRKGWSL